MAKVNIVMDMSMYDMFLLCPYRFRNRYKLNVTAHEKNENLDRGTLIHLACEVYYQCLKDGKKYDDAVHEALMKLRSAFVIESELSHEEANLIFSTMEEYFDHWRIEDQRFEILGVEEPFMYLLYEDDDIRIYSAGKIDIRVRDNHYDNLPMDHKSFKRSGPINELSNQFKNYCLVSQSNILLVNRIGLQKTLPPEKKFLRVPASYDHLVFESWKKNVVANLMWYLECEASNYWPTNETSCEKFNRMCEYHEVCKSSGEESKMFKLSQMKAVEPWDVTKVMKRTSEAIIEVVK